MERFGALALLIPIVTMVALFTFLSIAVWSEERRKERESYYRSEMLKKLLEQPGAAADRVLEMMREEELRAAEKRREGRLLGGLVTMAAGVGLSVFLWAIETSEPVWLVGVISFLIGAVIFGFSFFSARPAVPGATSREVR